MTTLLATHGLSTKLLRHASTVVAGTFQERLRLQKALEVELQPLRKTQTDAVFLYDFRHIQHLLVSSRCSRIPVSSGAKAFGRVPSQTC